MPKLRLLNILEVVLYTRIIIGFCDKHMTVQILGTTQLHVVVGQITNSSEAQFLNL